MKKINVEITETDLDIIRMALSILENYVIKDTDSVIKQKMPNETDKLKYLDAIKNTSKKFREINQ